MRVCLGTKFTLVALVVALLSATAAAGAVAKEKLPPIDISEAESCDFAEPSNPLCMLPFPDDYYTARSGSAGLKSACRFSRI